MGDRIAIIYTHNHKTSPNNIWQIFCAGKIVPFKKIARPSASFKRKSLRDEALSQKYKSAQSYLIPTEKFLK